MDEEFDIEGVIYPVPYDLAMNIFKKNKKIFVKYLTHEPTKKTVVRLKKGMKLYIYSSQSKKVILGEGVIDEISFLNRSEILSKFDDELFISESELRDYSKGRESKKAQVLKIKNIVLYPKGKIVKRAITMTGIYVTGQNKKSIFGNQKNINGVNKK
ncbi:DUF365 domain-containing protein [Candidatus Woesearchaeota archaeon]|nr:DUF365 domain-containing protein [Candidatus Woesearchaeota archaeon]